MPSEDTDWRTLEAQRQHQALLDGTHIYRVSWVCDHQHRDATWTEYSPRYIPKPKPHQRYKPHQIFRLHERAISA